jgi:hypothetical protein
MAFYNTKTAWGKAMSHRKYMDSAIEAPPKSKQAKCKSEFQHLKKKSKE